MKLWRPKWALSYMQKNTTFFYLHYKGAKEKEKRIERKRERASPKKHKFDVYMKM